ncbi:MAG: DUF3276 family protein [Treponema sp.]|nr:DUF3276 family protein [Treponema sp.]
MGLRGELFSTKVLLQNRTYFFNVKENRMGDLYLNIVESKNRETGGFDRQSIILFANDLQEFLKGFDESLRVLEKEIREKRRNTKTVTRDNDPKDDAQSGTKGKPRTGTKSGTQSGARNKPAKESKRVVVRKNKGLGTRD